MNPWLLLTIAILSEVIASSSLKLADGFTRLVPSVVVVLGYASALWLAGKVMQKLPLGTVYAIWSGAGTALTALVGLVVYSERLGFWQVLGIVMIVGGVALLNLATRDGTRSG